jgi:primosomal protein N'
VTVTPFSKVKALESLSYVARQALTVGTVVMVPVRASRRPALVTSCAPLSQSRQNIRSAHFALKPLGATEPRSLFYTSFLGALEHAAHLHTVSFASLLSLMTPICALSAQYAIPEHTTRTVFSEQNTYDISSVIEKSSGATLLLVPTREHAKALAVRFKKYKPVVLHGARTAHSLVTAWTSLESTLFIATCTYMGVPLSNLQTLILYDAHDEGYVSVIAPHVDFRDVARGYAARHALSLYWHTPPLQIPLSHTLIDLSSEKHLLHDDSAVHDSALTHLSHAPAGAHHFVWTHRTGRSSRIVCADCRTDVRCPRCTHTLAVHTKGSDRLLICHACTHTETARRPCTHCGSWHLVMYGTGTEHVADILHKKLSIPVHRLDGYTTTAGARTWLKEGGVLVGTSSTFGFLEHVPQLHTSLLTQTDIPLTFTYLSAQPHLLVRLATLASRSTHLLLQTRMPKHFFFSELSTQAPAHILKTLSEENKSLGLSGAATITLTAPLSDATTLSEHLSPFSPTKVHTADHVVYTIVLSQWPHELLRTLLYSLPASIRKQVSIRSTFSVV